jgi:hypothetical protein
LSGYKVEDVAKNGAPLQCLEIGAVGVAGNRVRLREPVGERSADHVDDHHRGDDARREEKTMINGKRVHLGIITAGNGHRTHPAYEICRQEQSGEEQEICAGHFNPSALEELRFDLGPRIILPAPNV